MMPGATRCSTGRQSGRCVASRAMKVSSSRRRKTTITVLRAISDAIPVRFPHLYGIFLCGKIPLRQLKSNQDAWLGLARLAARTPSEFCYVRKSRLATLP